MTQEKKTENLIIAGVWVVIFVLPALYLYYVSVTDGSEFDGYELWQTWKLLIPFAIMFCVHHYLLIQLYNKRQFAIYAFTMVAILGCYLMYMLIFKPGFPRKDMMRGPVFENRDHWRHDNHFDGAPPFPGEGLPPQHMPKDFDRRERKGEQLHPQPHHNEKIGPKYLLLRAPVMGRLVIALLMMGVDLGVVSLINSGRTRSRLLQLQKEKLAMELEYLKYQINPHFFMNTLNNIHALVDIDQEAAKRTIIDLSGLMRYVLYDSGEELVPLEKEIQFIKLYISLMRIRYSSKVDIQVNTPDNMGGVMVPPLLFICFVENAFKHGVSNRHQSFINIYVSFDDKKENLSFLCVNSILEQEKKDNHHGIGIENARKRLELIYGEDYVLRIKENEEKTFEVWLQIPISQQA